MLLDTRLVPETIVRPRSFVGLMSLYESNYLRLLHVVPELERIDGCFQSRVAGDCTLFVDILDRERYTITLSMSYQFQCGEDVMRDPDLRVRAYLDGRLAEAQWLGDTQHHATLQQLRNRHRHELDERWRRNVILNKWLDYLIEQGHLILDR